MIIVFLFFVLFVCRSVCRGVLRTKQKIKNRQSKYLFLFSIYIIFEKLKTKNKNLRFSKSCIVNENGKKKENKDNLVSLRVIVERYAGTPNVRVLYLCFRLFVFMFIVFCCVCIFRLFVCLCVCVLLGNCVCVLSFKNQSHADQVVFFLLFFFIFINNITFTKTKIFIFYFKFFKVNTDRKQKKTL